MPLLLRRDKGSRLTIDELDDNLVFLNNYANLTNKPTIPSLVGYATESYVNTAIANNPGSTGATGPQGPTGATGPQGPAGTTDYNNLINKPTIPTDINQLTDASGLLAGGGLVASVNEKTGAITLTTSDITEGTNLYFTNARARSALSAGTGISYNSTTGVISISSVPNSSLSNSSITIGSTSISLGGTATSVAGLVDVVTKKASYADSNNVSKVYTYYNEETQSLDTVFE